MRSNCKIYFCFRMPSAAPAVENGAGPPKSELEELQIKANQVTDEVCTNILIHIVKHSF